MADIWIVLIEDRHSDVGAYPFSTEERAVAYARAWAGPHADGDGELTDGMRRDGWVLYLPYGTEGDCVRVVRQVLDAPP